MKTSKSKKLSMQTYLSIYILALGILVMIYGIIVEDEPTAVALLLIVTGTVWFFVTRFRMRSLSKTESKNS